MGLFDTSLPLDFGAEQEALNRKRAIAQAMLQSSMQPAQGQMVSGRYVGPGFLGELSKVAGSVLASKMNSDLDQQSTDLTKRYNQGLSDSVQQYLKTRDGYTTTQPDISKMTGSLDDQDAPQQSINVPGDKRRAIAEAMASQYKPLQQMATADLATVNKQEPFQAFIQQMTGQGGGQAPAATKGGTPAPTTDSQGNLTGPSAIMAKIAPHVDPTTAMGLYASDPSGQKLMAAEVEMAKPVVGRGDGLYENVPGGGVRLKQGYVSGVQAVEGAKKDIANAGTIAEDTDPQTGQPIRRTVAQQVQAATGNSSVMPAVAGTAQVPQGATPPTNSGELYPGYNMMQQLPTNMRQGILNNMQQSGTQQAMIHVQHPETGQIIQGMVDLGGGQNSGAGQPSTGAQTPPTGANPVTAPANPPTQVPGGGYATGLSPTVKSYLDEKGKNNAAQEQSIYSSIPDNRAKLANTTQMLADLPSISSGPIADTVTTLKGLATQLGAQGLDPSPNQTFDKYAYQNAVNGLSKQYGGKVAVQEMNQALKNNPGTGMAKVANAALLLTNKAVLERELQKGDAYATYAQNPQNKLEQFPLWFDKNYPMPKLSDVIKSGMQGALTAGGSGMPDQTGAAATSTPQAPIELDDYLKSKGVK